jgi:hypothetical protein
MDPTAKVRIIEIIVSLGVRKERLMSELIAVTTSWADGLQAARCRGSEKATDPPGKAWGRRGGNGHGR